MFSARGPCLIMEALSSLLEAMRKTTHCYTQEQITSHFLSGQHQSKDITHESKRRAERDILTTLCVFSLNLHWLASLSSVWHVGIHGERAHRTLQAIPIISDFRIRLYCSFTESLPLLCWCGLRYIGKKKKNGVMTWGQLLENISKTHT